MFYNLIHSAFERPNKVVPIKCSYNKLTVERTSKNGIISKTSVFKKFSTADVLGKFTANDFSLSNILAIGAYDMLKPVYAPDTSALHTAQQVENELNTIINDASSENK